jgi:hypothetical protein
MTTLAIGETMSGIPFTRTQIKFLIPPFIFHVSSLLTVFESCGSGSTGEWRLIKFLNGGRY